MATNPQKVRVLADQILSLDPDDRLELLQRVVTPELELRLLVESLQKKVVAADPRAITQDINRTVREVRSRRRSASTLYTRPARPRPARCDVKTAVGAYTMGMQGHKNAAAAHLPDDRPAARRSTKPSANSDILETARSLGIDPSSAPEDALAKEVQKRQREAWLRENREAINAYNEDVAQHGVFSSGLRGF